MSVCLLMAALYEQTPFTNGELRRRIYRDFTTLKRHFRCACSRALNDYTSSALRMQVQGAGWAAECVRHTYPLHSTW